MKNITRRTSLLAGASLALALCLGYAVPTYAGSGTVIVNLLDSHGAGLAGGVVQYYQSGWQTLGTTDGSGMVSGTVPVTTDIAISYMNGSYKWVNVDPTTSPTLTINTKLVTVKLQTCGGTPLAGQAKYYNGGEYPIGNTPATIELLPGSYDFRMFYGGRARAWKQQNIAADPVVVFTTTKVTLWPSVGNTYYNNGWQPLINGTELIGGTDYRGPISQAEVRFGGMQVYLNITGCSVEKTAVQIRLINSTGAGIAGGTVYYFAGGSSNPPYPALPGATDANGNLFAVFDGKKGSTEWTMNHAYLKTSKQQDPTLGPVVFQTKLVTVELRDSAGNLEDTGTSVTYWGAGADRTFGTGSTSGGKVTMELLPMNTQFNMTYLFTRGVVGPQNVVANPTVTFRTGKVVSTGGTCTSYWMAGGFRPFTNPMELFPANYEFHFSDAPTAQNFTITAGIVNTIR